MEPFDITKDYVHLSREPHAVVLPSFEWSEEYLSAYDARFADDGDAGRLVCVLDQHETWSTWERHPSGDEVVVLLSGRIDVIWDVEGSERRIALSAGQALINPKGVWHTSDVHEPGSALFITPGRGTEHRERVL